MSQYGWTSSDNFSIKQIFSAQGGTFLGGYTLNKKLSYEWIWCHLWIRHPAPLPCYAVLLWCPVWHTCSCVSVTGPHDCDVSVLTSSRKPQLLNPRPGTFTTSSRLLLSLWADLSTLLGMLRRTWSAVVFSLSFFPPSFSLPLHMAMCWCAECYSSSSRSHGRLSHICSACCTGFESSRRLCWPVAALVTEAIQRSAADAALATPYV